MTKQLKGQGINDGRLKYNADGNISTDKSQLELLLMEVSSAYGDNDKGKTSFDQYKAMFGMLAMLRTLADHVKLAKFETFSRIKVHFLHAHDRAVRHWTMHTPAPGLYIMNKEQKTEIPVDFSSKGETLIPFIKFYLTLGTALKETLDVKKKLNEEHKVENQRTRFQADPKHRPSLLKDVDPVIIRLNEGKHLREVAYEGPRSAPGSPAHVSNTQ